MTVDSNLYLDINNFSRHTSWLHTPIADFAKYGLVVFAILMLIAWWYARRQPDRVMSYALLAPVVAALAIAINQPIARMVAEERPYRKFPNAMVLLSKNGDWSFPSDHSVLVGAITLAVFYVSRRLGYISLGFALLMAFARVYAGVHYPQDVIVGLIEGAIVALVLCFIFVSPMTRLVRLVRTSKIGGLLIAGE